MQSGTSRDDFECWLSAFNDALVGRIEENLRPVSATATQGSAALIRVLLVDDHALMRLSLRTVLETEPDIDVVGEAGNGAEALAKTVELLPDLVLLDMKMPAPGGIEVTSAIKAAAPSTRVVMLTMSEDDADLYEAIKVGASGYLLKDELPHELADSIRAVAGGQPLISPPMAAKLLTEFVTMVRSGEEQTFPGPPELRLTDRELEVLKLIATGANISKIAKSLFISDNAVKNHARNILEKLWWYSGIQAASRRQPAWSTRRPGLLPPHT